MQGTTVHYWYESIPVRFFLVLGNEESCYCTLEFKLGDGDGEHGDESVLD